MLDTLFLLVQGQSRLFAHWKVCSWYLSQSESCFSVWAHRFLHPTRAATWGRHTQHWEFQGPLHWRICFPLQHNWLQQQMLKLPKGRRIVTRDSALSHVASKTLLRESWERHWILAAGQADSGMCLSGGIVIEGCDCGKLSQWSHSSREQGWSPTKQTLLSHQATNMPGSDLAQINECFSVRTQRPQALIRTTCAFSSETAISTSLHQQNLSSEIGVKAQYFQWQT